MGWQQPHSPRSRCLGKSDEQDAAAAWRNISLRGIRLLMLESCFDGVSGSAQRIGKILLAKWPLAGAASRAHFGIPFFTPQGSYWAAFVPEPLLSPLFLGPCHRGPIDGENHASPPGAQGEHECGLYCRSAPFPLFLDGDDVALRFVCWNEVCAMVDMVRTSRGVEVSGRSAFDDAGDNLAGQVCGALAAKTGNLLLCRAGKRSNLLLTECTSSLDCF
ncbi:hypothetical protein B0T14DRAFT_246001 [Immersiella caudata]|uniref:Uncharacterized protein n=1 Tax=Immersiella caudata TaxID=314043 RepID=A0AA40BWP7_9PEZI|nr:hypothetical protein B0T14DRAFT_246001 [Immersiella caudata]